MSATTGSSAREMAEEFLAQSPIPLFIGGELRHACGGDEIALVRPSDGSPLASVAAGTAADIDDAVNAAAAASAGWAATPVSERAALLHRLADAIERDKEILATLESRDLGKPYHEALDFDIGFAAAGYRYFADVAVHSSGATTLALPHLAAKQVRLPRGVCGFIVPWNAPFILAAWGCAPALAAGNTVVLKPAELAPLTPLYLARLADEVGFPAGVVNVVPGLGAEAGAALAGHPRLNMISFTGSPVTGVSVAKAAAANLTPSKLELGGKGAAIVFPDVDVTDVAGQLTAAITRNAGQTCCTATRWVVHEDILSDFLADVTQRLAAVRLGHDESDAELGAVVSEGQRQRILGYLQQGREQGADFVFDGGTDPLAGYEDGFYVRPALLMGDADNVCAREEIFGPVAYVMPFRDADTAVAMVNDTSYGLANSVWSQDLDRAEQIAERMVSGNSWINAHNVFAYGLPYGGVNLSGWGGGVNSPQTLTDYQRELTVARPLA